MNKRILGYALAAPLGLIIFYALCWVLVVPYGGTGLFNLVAVGMMLLLIMFLSGLILIMENK